MIKIEDIIGNLLLRHNCVIIPGFGGFVAKQIPARIDYKNGILSPPSKSLLFNRQLINNDGLLISELALQHTISYNESTSKIDQLIADWNSELSAGNRISIDKIGFLFFDQERNICFEQDRYFNLLLSSYGLGSVHFLTETDIVIANQKTESELSVKLVEETVLTPEIKTEIIVDKQPIIVLSKEKKVIQEHQHVNTQFKKSNFWKYAAATLLIPILFYSLWIPMKTDVLESKIISFQDFNPFHKKGQAVYKQESISNLIKDSEKVDASLEKQLEVVESDENVYSYNLTEDTYLLVDTGVGKVGNNENQVYKVINLNKSFNYIVGCFSDETNAQNLVNELNSKGFSAFIKDKKGNLSRVSIGATDSQDELDKLISKANSAGFKGWILK
jgi:nucleoid DNA-binding protein